MALDHDKPGYIMILASLVVMGLTVYLLFSYQVENREQQAREQGLGLVRLMSSMSWNQVVNLPGRKGLLEAFRQGQNNPDFAYGVITDRTNQVKSEVVAAGVIAPNHPVPAEPSAWLGLRTVSGVDDRVEFIESHAPLFENQQHMGFVRIGYFKPRLQLDYQQMPFIATLTLPIFLLTPLFYFFLRQEIRPLSKISQSIEQFTRSQSLELQPSAELGNFMDRFNQFIEMTQSRIEELNSEQNDLLMSSKLLSYKNNRVETILQTIPEALMVMDEAGIVSYANDRIESLLGVEPSAIINRKPTSWCQSEELLSLLSGQNRKGPVSSISLTPGSGSGANRELRLEVRNYPLFAPTDDSKLLGRLVVISDVTEHYQAQRRQGEFISQIAHELKTPLNVLSMYSESLLEEGIDSAEHRIEAANVIHDEVERLSTLIQNLLSLTQCELGGLVIERQRVRVGDFLQDIFDSMSKGGKTRDTRFEIDVPREMGYIYIDKALMRIAVNNLLSNAIKYNKPGGLVRLEAVESTFGIEIRVIDEGLGISEQDQQRIFDKFFRSEDAGVREQTGHGLGLALAQQIVHIHQGEIAVDSKPGEGSTFRISLEKGNG